MNKTFFITLVAGFLITLMGCSPKISTKTTNTSMNPLGKEAEVVVINVSQSMRSDATLLGHLKIGDTGFTTDCDYDKVISEAKKKARQIGGNIVKITELREPTTLSTCYKLEADVLYSYNLKEIKTVSIAERDSIRKMKFGDNPHFAIIYVYRLRNYSGSAVSYDLHIDDSVICRVKNNTKYEIKVFKEGEIELWGRTETRASMTIDVKFGQEYYLKCGVKMGLAIGRPEFNLIDKSQGKPEYESMKGRTQ